MKWRLVGMEHPAKNCAQCSQARSVPAGVRPIRRE
jgi:hypothetical protein